MSCFAKVSPMGLGHKGLPAVLSETNSTSLPPLSHRGISRFLHPFPFTSGTIPKVAP